MANYLEGIVYGADVTMVDGLISDCARMVAEGAEARRNWFDISTLKEPFRVEGKKTMGYELVEQLGWTYPDAVFYPTGGGVGLIGMWKAFEEMEELGWVSGKRPKMIALQASGCAPRRQRLRRGAAASTIFQNAATFAAGLRVPKPYGDSIILDIVRESGGTGRRPAQTTRSSLPSSTGPQPEGPVLLPRRRRRHRRLRPPARDRPLSPKTASSSSTPAPA